MGETEEKRGTGSGAGRREQATDDQVRGDSGWLSPGWKVVLTRCIS